MDSLSIKMRGILRAHFGRDGLLPDERPVIESIMAGRNVLCVQSAANHRIIYQAPAMTMSGLCIVILNDLERMQHEVTFLNRQRIATCSLHSQLDHHEIARRIALLADGAYKFLYLTPAQFTRTTTRAAILSAASKAGLAYLVLDECHRASLFGHEFSSTHARCAAAARQLKLQMDSPCATIAMSICADEQTRKDVKDSLGGDEWDTHLHSQDPKHISLCVMNVESNAQRFAELVRILERAPHQSPAVVIATSIKSVDSLHSRLEKSNMVTSKLHSRLTKEQQQRHLGAFLKGQVKCIVTTAAAAPRLCRRKVDLIVHYHTPSFLMDYFQVISSLARNSADGAASYLIHFANDDQSRAARFLEQRCPPVEAFVAMRSLLLSDLTASWPASTWAEKKALAEALGGAAEPSWLTAIISHLVDTGLAQWQRQNSSSGWRSVLKVLNPNAELRLDLLEHLRRNAERSIDTMRRLCLVSGCRRSLLLEYLEDPGRRPSCCNCDNCVPELYLGEPAGRATLALDETPERATMGSEMLLRQALVLFRSDLAKSLQIPEVGIFPQAALDALLRRPPRKLDDLRSIPGLTPGRIEKFGQKLIQTCRDVLRTTAT